MAQNLATQLGSIVIGGTLGALVGVPLSYFFQIAALREANSLGKYVGDFTQFWSNQENGIGNTVRITVLVSAVVFVLISSFLTSLIASSLQAKEQD